MFLTVFAVLPLEAQCSYDFSNVLMILFLFCLVGVMRRLEGYPYVLDGFCSLGLGSPFVFVPMFLWSCSESIFTYKYVQYVKISCLMYVYRVLHIFT